MPINNITQTVSTLPPAGSRGVDIQTQFVIKQEDFQDHLQGITVDELNTLKDQLNSRIGEINSTATTMNGYADTASAGASTATTKAGEASTSASDALSYKNQAETFKNNASASATKASQWSDNNYNVEVEAGRYSAKHWSTVAQNTTANKVDKVTSTDNAVVRFNGTTGQVQNSGVIIDDNGNVGVGTSTPIHSISSYKATGWNTGVGTQSGNRFIQLSVDSSYGTDIFWDSTSLLRFSTGSASVGTGYTERMRIGASGNVVIGTTTDNGLDKLQINGSIRANNLSSFISKKGNGSTFSVYDYSSSHIVCVTFNIGFQGFSIGLEPHKIEFNCYKQGDSGGLVSAIIGTRKDIYTGYGVITITFSNGVFTVSHNEYIPFITCSVTGSNAYVY